MALETLVDQIRQSSNSLIPALQAGDRLSPLRLRRSARLPVLAAIHASASRPVLLLTDRADRALSLADELALWAPQVTRLFFPEPTPLFYENAAWGDTTRRDRLIALTTLAGYHIPGAPGSSRAPLIIAPARAIMTRTIPRRDFLKATSILRRGQTVHLDDLTRSWVNIGYESANTVIIPGQFARRGGILDLWPPAELQPIRLEFFGDELETLRRFDPTSQRTYKSPGIPDPERVLITPAREFIASWSEDQAHTDIGQGLAPPFEGPNEFYIPVFHPFPASLLDYLPHQALVVIDDLQAFQDIINEFEEQAVSLRRESIQEGTLPADFPVPYLTLSEIQDALGSRQPLELGLPVEGSNLSEVEHPSLANQFEPGPRFGGRLKPAMEYLQENSARGDSIIIVSRQFARLAELWAESNPTLPPPQFLEGSLSEGWIFKAPGAPAIHLLTDGEIFGWRRTEPRQRHRPVPVAPEAAYADLQPGDWVVHSDHGIGHFIGLVNRTVEGVEHEYLCIEYADEAQLYVPIHQVDRLTRYVGPEGRPPIPSRLGSSEWRTVKAHVKEAVQEVAEDLLELYARRNIVAGHAFNPDSAWQQELEASFPYIETEDQKRVIAEVKTDMESIRPMDRLICGDVGYGKTEVALRAAFKAVNDGKQVAVLVPTTVLAQQHYNTFTQRLAAFPVNVEMLSRFRSQQQQNEILKRLAQGAVDIIIGTHRLLSTDVRFKDLGLLVIDEEQRFGVTHKEALKKLRTEVDVLTLTATPIPRTLYMALSGVRDISTINTPPEERLPIVTHIGPYSPRLVRQAILRELERGGQVFFVHNRVQTIQAMRHHVESLVPEARLAVAHGQMPEWELAQRMEQFTNGEVDVLMSTSIIESGLDIPSANTLIVDRADTFGLAQLYQLRGRVGRGAQRAYAYFFRHNRKLPTLEGRQRLETIAENSQLGAGFSIAMRDLEIRGTGDILGTRQHGHIAAVGFHLYTRLLAESVRRLREQGGLPVPGLLQPVLSAMNAPLSLVNVELPLQINLPAEYVPDKNVRLGLYRRLADVRSSADIDALREEFTDRFGPPPNTVINLFLQMRVRLLAETIGLSSISAESGQIVLRFPDGALPADLPDLSPGVRAGKVALWISYMNNPDWPDRILQALEKLVQWKSSATTGATKSQWVAIGSPHSDFE